jgi:hypothetical protein
MPQSFLYGIPPISLFQNEPSWTVLKTWQIGSFSDSIGLYGFGAKACGGSQGFSMSMTG